MRLTTRLHLVRRLKNEWSYTSLPHMLHGVYWNNLFFITPFFLHNIQHNSFVITYNHATM